MAQTRFATIKTSAGEKLQLAHMSGHESLGECFVYDVQLISEDPDVDENGLLGKNATIQVSLPERKTRYFHGIITNFGYGGTDGRHIVYHATLRPWLWLLSQASDCRIFQHATVPEVVSTLFREHGFSDGFKLTLSREYPQRDYIVQYRESTLAFVQRLLEREGIYYYFKHDESTYSMEIVDDVSAHTPETGYEKIPFFPPNRFNEKDHIAQWSAQRRVRTGAYATNEFNFKTANPSGATDDLAVDLLQKGKYLHSDKELYEYPGGYEVRSDGERYVRARACELAQAELGFSGHGNARGLGVGRLFELSNFPSKKLNCQYLITATSYRIDAGDFESHEMSESAAFYCSVDAVDSSCARVAKQTTPRPIIAGPQTATVVGAAGEEIWTDQYARVKVQFHWDRVGKRNEDSSCWIRVSQLWAGSGWGGIHIPRIGQEVIVEFLEGDPDRPIITGRVYNSANMPPYSLPDNQTQSGIRSHSTPKGGVNNFNELRFEDKKDAEQVYVQAERNMDTLVKNDQTLHVCNNRTKNVDVDETTEIGRNRDESVAGNESIQISGTRTEIVSKAESITLEDLRTTDIAKGDRLGIGEEYRVTVGKDATLSVKGSRSISIDQHQSTKVKGDRKHEVNSDTFQVKTKLVIEAGQEIVFRTGAASLTLKSNGDVVIRGKSLSVTASDKVNIRATSDVQIKGARNAQN